MNAEPIHEPDTEPVPECPACAAPMILVDEDGFMECINCSELGGEA